MTLPIHGVVSLPTQTALDTENNGFLPNLDEVKFTAQSEGARRDTILTSWLMTCVVLHPTLFAMAEESQLSFCLAQTTFSYKSSIQTSIWYYL
jgi:hypothetical protein